MLSDRRRRVLQALVEEYVTSASPVGSHTLVAHHDLGCSPATVRNELSILEETGYVTQPHVSAGRIPTDVGYRDFVDALLSGPERASVQRDSVPLGASLSQVTELDGLMREASLALTRLTDCIAVAISPSVGADRVIRLNLVPLSSRKLLLVVVTDSGQVVNRSIDLVGDLDAQDVVDIERWMSHVVVGKRPQEFASATRELRATERSGLAGTLLGELAHALADADPGRLHHGGVSALLAQPEFRDAGRARLLVEFLEDEISVLDALSAAFDDKAVSVRIGRENARAELGEVSVVATNYAIGGDQGLLAVIGPTRMDYARSIRAVRRIASEIEDVVG